MEFFPRQPAKRRPGLQAGASLTSRPPQRGSRVNALESMTSDGRKAKGVNDERDRHAFRLEKHGRCRAMDTEKALRLGTAMEQPPSSILRGSAGAKILPRIGFARPSDEEPLTTLPTLAQADRASLASSQVQAAAVSAAAVGALDHVTAVSVLPPHLVGLNPLLEQQESHEMERDVDLLEQRTKLQNWLTQFREERTHFHSAAVFADLKLQGLVDDKDVKPDAPSGFKTGVAVTLLNELLSLSTGPNAHLVMRLWKLIVDSVYPGTAAYRRSLIEALQDPTSPESMKAKGKKFNAEGVEVRDPNLVERSSRPMSMEAQRGLSKELDTGSLKAADVDIDPAAADQKASTPYFEMYAQLKRQNTELIAQLRIASRFRLEVEAEHMRLKNSNRASILAWGNRYAALCFGGWKRTWEEASAKEKQARRVIKSLRSKWKVGGPECFDAWRLFHEEQKQVKKVQNHFEVAGIMKEMTKTQELDALKVQLHEGVEVVVHTKTQLRDLRQQLAPMYKELFSWRQFGEKAVHSLGRASGQLKEQLAEITNCASPLVPHKDAATAKAELDSIQHHADFLAVKDKNSRRLMKAPMQSLLLKWANLHLAKAKVAPVDNFTSAWSGGTNLLYLLNQLNPKLCPTGKNPEAVSAMSKYERVSRGMKEAAALLPKGSTLPLCDTDVLQEAGHLILIFLSMLMVAIPALPVDKNDLCYKAVEAADSRLQNSLSNLLALVGEYKEAGIAEQVVNSRAPKVVDSLCSSFDASLDSHRTCAATMFINSSDWNIISVKSMNNLVYQQTHFDSDKSLEKEDRKDVLPIWWKLRPTHLQDLFDNDDPPEEREIQIQHAESVLLEWGGDASLVFKHYSLDEGGTGMCLRQWIRFVRDTGLFLPRQDGSKFGKKEAEIIFDQCRKKMAERPPSEQKQQPPDGQLEELSPVEFIESVVRLAKCSCINPSMRESVSLFITGNILPNATKLDMSNFEALLNEPNLVQIIQTFSVKLHKVYKHFAMQDKTATLSDAAFGKTMDLKELEIFAVAAQIIDDKFTTQKLTTVFLCVQNHNDQETLTDLINKVHMPEDDDEDHVLGMTNENSEITFNEFVEICIALACFKEPSPFDSTAHRCRLFFNAFITKLNQVVDFL